LKDVDGIYPPPMRFSPPPLADRRRRTVGQAGSISSNDQETVDTWRQWAVQYRDRAGSLPNGRLIVRPERLASPIPSGTGVAPNVAQLTSSPLPTRHNSIPINPFFILRRKFLPPRPNLITDTPKTLQDVNDINLLFSPQQLVRELLLALEDYQAAFGPPDSVDNHQPRLLIDRNRLRLLSNELDSVVGEIVSTVPDFSAALTQGSYGPLALPAPRRQSGTILCRDYEPFEPQEVNELSLGTFWANRLYYDIAEALVYEGGEGEADRGKSECDSEELLNLGRRRWLEFQESRGQSPLPNIVSA